MASPKRQDLVLTALSRASGPRSANEIWEELGSSEVGIATIYRALKAGVEAGLVRAVDLPGDATRYEPADRGHHHHFLCSGCDRAYDLEGCVPGLDAILPPSFALTGHEILLYGTCADCQEAA